MHRLQDMPHLPLCDGLVHPHEGLAAGDGHGVVARVAGRRGGVDAATARAGLRRQPALQAAVLQNSRGRSRSSGKIWWCAVVSSSLPSSLVFFWHASTLPAVPELQRQGLG